MSWVSHVFGFDQGVKFFGAEVAEFDSGFAQAGFFVVRGVRDLGGVVVSDFGGECGDQHERIFHVVIDDLAVELDSLDAIFDETDAGIAQQFDGVQIIENHYRLENI
jgi:hypothetical protein